jgi:hypothetical protein
VVSSEVLDARPAEGQCPSEQRCCCTGWRVTVNKALGAVVTVAVGAASVGTLALVLHSAQPKPPTLVATVTGTASPTPATPGVTTKASINLSTYPDSSAITWRRTGGGVGPHPDWVSYGPTTNLQVPAHTLVTVTIKQYDTGEAIPNPFLARIHGTLGGIATIDGKAVKAIDAEHVGHTFTIHNFPSSKQTPLFVSVPLPAVADDAPNAPGSDFAKPHIVRFQFVTGTAGTYAWNCEFPCGGNYANFGEAMSTFGYMSGTLKVV